MNSDYRMLTAEEKNHYTQLRDERLEKFSSIDSKLALNGEESRKAQELLSKKHSSYDLEKTLNIAYSRCSNSAELPTEKLNLIIDTPKVPNSTVKCPDCKMISLYKKEDIPGETSKAKYQCQLCDSNYEVQLSIKTIISKVTKIN